MNETYTYYGKLCLRIFEKLVAKQRDKSQQNRLIVKTKKLCFVLSQLRMIFIVIGFHPSQ